MSFPAIYDDDNPVKITKLLGVETKPTLILLNQKGVVVARYNDFYPDRVKADLLQLGIKY